MATGYNIPSTQYTTKNTTTSTGASNVPMPEVMPYVPPAWDTNRIESLTQELGASGIGKLRRGLESGIASLQYTDNPYARKEQTQNLLKGYGEGIGGITTGARQGALNVYGGEYGAQAEAGKASWLEKMLREHESYQTKVASETATTAAKRTAGGSASGTSKAPVYYNIPQPLSGMSIGTSGGGGKVGGSGWAENSWASSGGGGSTDAIVSTPGARISSSTSGSGNVTWW